MIRRLLHRALCALGEHDWTVRPGGDARCVRCGVAYAVWWHRP